MEKDNECDQSCEQPDEVENQDTIVTNKSLQHEREIARPALCENQYCVITT
jgi:hypothetical protein